MAPESQAASDLQLVVPDMQHDVAFEAVLLTGSGQIGQLYQPRFIPDCYTPSSSHSATTGSSHLKLAHLVCKLKPRWCQKHPLRPPTPKAKHLSSIQTTTSSKSSINTNPLVIAEQSDSASSFHQSIPSRYTIAIAVSATSRAL